MGSNLDFIHQAFDITSLASEDGLNGAYGSFIIFMNDIKDELRLQRGFVGKPYTALEYIPDEKYVVPDQVRNKIVIKYE